MPAKAKNALLYPLYWVFQVGSFLTGLLPPPVGYWLMQRAGDVAYWLLPLRRRITAENFARVLQRSPQDQEVRRLARASWRNYGCYLYEVARLPHLSMEQILQRVTIHNEEHLQRALAHGKGVIFVSAHFGNMDMAAVALAHQIAPMTIAGTALKPRKLMDKLVEYRAAKGLKMSVYEGAARDVLMALRRNETVGFLVDVGVRWNGGVPVDFFGQTAPFPAGLALLSLKTGSPIVPGYTIVRPDHSIQVFVEPPIFLQPSGDKEADTRVCMQQVARVLETFISQYPDQWYMYRPMWASRAEEQR